MTRSPPSDLDPDQTAAIMIHIAPQCVASILDHEDADFLAAVAVGETFHTIPSLTRRRVADRLWARACAYRARTAALAAVAAALVVSTPADAARHPYAETLSAYAPPDTEMH